MPQERNTRVGAKAGLAHQFDSVAIRVDFQRSRILDAENSLGSLAAMRVTKNIVGHLVRNDEGDFVIATRKLRHPGRNYDMLTISPSV